MAAKFQRIAIVGLGLIGGSWALALRRAGVRARRIGFDRPQVLKMALSKGAIDQGSADLGGAVREADLVILAAPVGTILEQIPALKTLVAAGAFITDTGSTKSQICAKARAVFTEGPLFMGGHPLAGKERSGFAEADEKLFDGARYVLIPLAPEHLADDRAKAFATLLREIGARPYVAGSEVHDRAAAFLSHLPQLMATGLAGMVSKQAGGETLPLELAALGFREMTRLAESPYAIWRDICVTNRTNIVSALDAMIESLKTIRKELGDAALEKAFNEARDFRRRLGETAP